MKLLDLVGGIVGGEVANGKGVVLGHIKTMFLKEWKKWVTTLKASPKGKMLS